MAYRWCILFGKREDSPCAKYFTKFDWVPLIVIYLPANTATIFLYITQRSLQAFRKERQTIVEIEFLFYTESVLKYLYRTMEHITLQLFPRYAWWWSVYKARCARALVAPVRWTLASGWQCSWRSRLPPALMRDPATT